jgi:hypothetical protein
MHDRITVLPPRSLARAIFDNIEGYSHAHPAEARSEGYLRT